MRLHHARLDRRTGTKVLCGRGTVCDGHLAALTPAGIRTLPGWAPRDDGVWRLTNHARRRVARGLSPKLRRSFVAVASDRPDRAMEGLAPTNLIEGPAIFACPTCGQGSLVDPARLVSPPRYDDRGRVGRDRPLAASP